MKKYSKRIVLDYLNGNDIEGFTLEELENNKDFMFDVLKITRDKRMYDFCSDELKRDYSFIKKVVFLFQDDYLFLMDIFDAFTCNMDINDIVVFDFLCILANIEEKMKQNSLFSALALAKYAEGRTIADTIIEEETNSSMLRSYGLGFSIIMAQYENSEAILTYFAKKFVEEIFYQNENLSLEDFMHKNFGNLYQIDDINTLLIGYISIKDSYLADYISVHMEVLNKLKEDLEIVKKNWKGYIRAVNEAKVTMLYDEMWKNIEEHINTIDYMAILDSVAIELGLQDVFAGENETLIYKEKYAVNDDEEEMALSFKRKLKMRVKKLFAVDYLDRKANDYEEKIVKIVK